MNIHTLETILHFIVVIGIFFAASIWIVWGVLHKSRKNYILTPILYLAHLFIFYAITILEILPRDIYTIWTDLVFIHSIIVLISAGLVMLKLVEKEA